MKSKLTLENLPRIIEDLQEQVSILKNAHRSQDQCRNEEFLTRLEAMKILRISSYTTIIKMEKQGQLNSKRVGNRLLYRKSDILKLAGNR